MVDGVERSAVWHTTTAEVAPDLFVEFVFDAGDSVIAEPIDALGVSPQDAFEIALRQTYEASPAVPKQLPLKGLPDSLWVLAGEPPYVTAHALYATHRFTDGRGTRPAAVLVGVPRKTEVFCYPIDVTNLECAQDMAGAIAKFSAGYHRETQGAISPHVYWCDGSGRLSLLVDTKSGQAFPERLVQHVTSAVAGSA
jgi:hypothetical protein